MNYEIVKQDEMCVVGISIKTTNKDSLSTRQITELWERFYAENIREKISHKIDDNVIGLYIDYEGDCSEPYIVVAGCRVSSCDVIPEGMVAKKVPASKYAVFTAKGPLPDSIVNTWKAAWQTDLNRTYAGDFEVYSQKSHKDQDPEVDIYIAIE